MQTGQEKFGMNTFNQALSNLYFRHIISFETAMNVSYNTEELAEIIQAKEGYRVASPTHSPIRMRK
jgi:twitching motility protein PilT